jgi:hypothetical protein
MSSRIIFAITPVARAAWGSVSCPSALQWRPVRALSSTSSPPNINHTSDQAPKKSARELLKEYGKPGVATYLGVGTVMYAGCFAAVRSGIDAQGLLQTLGLTLPPAAGDLILSYALLKVTPP